MSFKKIIQFYNWEETQGSIYNKTRSDVDLALSKDKINLEDFKALISPAASDYVEKIATKSHDLTLKRFGKTVQMYLPMYLSNECQNICTYCGFSYDNDIERKTLNEKEILKEIEVIKSYGYDHILIVTGEANKTVGIDFFRKALKIIAPHFSHITMEVQPLEQNEYEELRVLGVTSILVYQETYRIDQYKLHHPKGKKSNFDYRLDTPDRLGKAMMHKIGLGVLFGLEDWRTDSFFCALHLSYLRKAYWKTKYSISFPRLRPCVGSIELKSNISDAELVQVIGAYRLFDEDLELSLSTRESENFRNHAFKIGITSMSAGSKTDPGGYAMGAEKNLKQFEVNDQRSASEFANTISAEGYDPVWKDWDIVLTNE